MKLSKLEQESIILYNEEESTASIYTHDPKLKRKLKRLAEKYPDRCTRIRPSMPERSATPCRKAASASGSRSATSGAGPPASAPKTPDIRRPQGVYTPKMNKNRAPAQESLPLRGRCHFRGKQPMK